MSKRRLHVYIVSAALDPGLDVHDDVYDIKKVFSNREAAEIFVSKLRVSDQVGIRITKHTVHGKVNLKDVCRACGAF